MDDLHQLELLSLVAKISQEVVNYTGINDKTIAEFIICKYLHVTALLFFFSDSFLALHDGSKSLAEFKQKLKDTGADFPDSFIETTDRLILSMHPKHKKKPAANGETNGKQSNGSISEAEKRRRMFPGLALPDKEWEPSVEKDVFMKEVDDMMAQLEGVQKKKKESDGAQEPRAAKRQRRSRSRSPRRSASPPRGRRDREDRYNDRYNDRGRRQQLDERAVLYKIYNGRVQTLKDFGAFVQLEGVAGRAEGEPNLSLHPLPRADSHQDLYMCQRYNKVVASTLHRIYSVVDSRSRSRS